ncbi:hypothetical protein BC829DRAFT_415062 [Chytridium lagenaria]|nr:hypothetical protein BC829DRAFT_415062 [Chytridium lagenaria]
MRFSASKYIAVLAVFAVSVFSAPVVNLEARGGSSPFQMRPFASNWNSAGNNYPIVMVHGLFGWGEKPLLGLLKYWGGLTSDIVGRMRDLGYTVHQPAMGPISSNWELWARELTMASLAPKSLATHVLEKTLPAKDSILPGLKLLITRSTLSVTPMGGPTSRMIAHLMAYGSAEEVAASVAAGVPVSPLFYTNKTSSYIHSATTVAGVLRGSTFDDYLNSNDLAVDFLLSLIKLLVGVNNSGIDLWDFQLGHWGLNPRSGEGVDDFVRRICSSPWFRLPSNALFDLTVAATRNPLLSFVRNSADTYYFSFTGDATYEFLGNYFARPDTLIFLQPTTNIVGSYTNRTLLGDDSRSWRPNDGLVNVVSAQGDNSGFNSYSLNLRASNSEVAGARAAKALPPKGRFNFLQTLEGVDHLKIIALQDLIGGQMDQVFVNVAGLQASLPR